MGGTHEAITYMLLTSQPKSNVSMAAPLMGVTHFNRNFVLEILY